jgi:thiamine-monophosphate kinase
VTNVSKHLSEFDLIKSYFAPLAASAEGAFGLTDDAAVITPPTGQSLVVTTDALVEGVHFLSDDTPQDIAAKLLRVSLSDLASMGAVPAFYSLAIAINSDISSDWLKAFAESLAADQAKFGITLIGGDTVSTPGPLTFSLTAMGLVGIGQELRRSGAQLGDDIWVSGTIGDGALGLRAATGEIADISDAHRNFLLSRYRRPQPRTLLGPELIGHVNAAIDISDGLIADLGHICATSKVGADIHIAAVPLSLEAQSITSKQPNYIDTVLGGGDDYELLFTADSAFEIASKGIGERANVGLTKIGTINDSKLIRIFKENGDEHSLSQIGYSHF